MDALRILQDAILDEESDDDRPDRTGSNQSILDYTAEQARAPPEVNRDEPQTSGDLTYGRAHSYRNFDPAELRKLHANSGNDEVQAVFAFIESGRIDDIAEALSEFFFKLDADEQELFIDRNPDLVQYMSAWNEAHGLNPFEDAYEQAQNALSADRSKALPAPPFERRELTHDTLLKDMMFRRRSYRNWSPFEFLEIAEREEIEVTRGMARELGMYKPEAREELDFPRTEPGRFVARTLFDRVEAGRFDPVLSEVQRLFVRLDLDERRLIAARNPGLITWILPWGVSEHVFSPDAAEMKVDWPPLEEIDNGSAAPVAGAPSSGLDPIPDSIMRAAQTFTADFDITTTGQNPLAEQHDKWYDAKSGTTGLYLRSHGVMIADKRDLYHHNQQFRRVLDRYDPPYTVIPWATAVLSGDWVVEMGRSHGGLTQAILKTDSRNVTETVTSAEGIRPEDIWAVAYTCAAVDVSEDGGLDYRYIPERFKGTDAANQFATTNRTEMEAFYDELMFAPSGRPEPLFDRDALAEAGPD